MHAKVATYEARQICLQSVTRVAEMAAVSCDYASQRFLPIAVAHLMQDFALQHFLCAKRLRSCTFGDRRG